MSIARLAAGDRRSSRLTREDALDALREYARIYGPEFTQAAFNPATMRRDDREDEYAERYASPRRDGSAWPSLNALKRATGMKWNEMRVEAGLPVNPPGGVSKRRPNGLHPPRSIEDRKVQILTRVVRSDREIELEADLRREMTIGRELRRNVKILREQLEASRASKRNVQTKREVVVREVPDKSQTKELANLRRQLSNTKGKLETARAGLREVSRGVGSLERRVASLLQVVDSERHEHAETRRELAAARDQITAASARHDRLAQEAQRLRELPVQTTEINEVEVVRDAELVASAERRADAAEVRAARAERMMAEQGAAVTGETRRLTPSEIAELTAKGPSGPAKMAEALGQLATARRHPGGGALERALTMVATAAITWRQQLR